MHHPSWARKLAVFAVCLGCGQVTRDPAPPDEPPEDPRNEDPPSGAPEPAAKHAQLGGGCAPLNERDPEFGGFNLDEVSIDENTPACASGTCVIQGFQGRVSCPYGQGFAEGVCATPGSGVPVLASVVPQLVDRPPAMGAVCSCHCAGPGPGPYCACPSHLQCTHLVDDLGFGNRDIAGSYCLPKSARYERGTVDVSNTCNRELANCDP
ncbi:MAG TPA: hypothetical protein VG937_06435 [Polyangiaceae bacterium]|nr:hypothetical protein [Polyangiaceae bacterium]